MDSYNLIITGFIIAAFFLALGWAFNTVRRIDNQKNSNAVTLTSILKLWRKAKFVPEDAKERESLYLYRDFLSKFDEEDCKYPIMVKNGRVRAMTRKEYDQLCGLKEFKPVSFIMVLLSLVIAGAALAVNIMKTKQIWLGVGLALILPVVQVALAFFVKRFIKEKDKYRDSLFNALKENSVAFLTITKPFIIMDAYPRKFGRNQKPLYAALGELTDEQAVETRDYIINQKAAETQVFVRRVNTMADAVDQVNQTQPVNPQPTAEVATVQPVSPVNNAPVDELPMTNTEKMVVVENLVNDMLKAEVDRAEQAAAPAEEYTPEVIEELPPIATPIANTSFAAAVEAPAENDFSLDAIGQALDAEIARRKQAR